MISAQSHKPERSRKTWVRKSPRYNKKFYDSKAWRTTRKSYINHLQHRVWTEGLKKIWKLKNGEHIELSDYQSSVLISLNYVPCEICLKLFCADAPVEIEKGEQLDHIDPLNPENALDSEGWGDPFDYNNLQLLCKGHHAKKSGRDKKVIEDKLNESD